MVSKDFRFSEDVTVTKGVEGGDRVPLPGERAGQRLQGSGTRASEGPRPVWGQGCLLGPMRWEGMTDLGIYEGAALTVGSQSLSRWAT